MYPELAIPVWETEESDISGSAVRVEVDADDEAVYIDQIGVNYVTVSLTFEHWDAIVAAVAAARKAGAR